MIARFLPLLSLLAIALAAPLGAQSTSGSLAWGDEVRVWAPTVADARIHGFLYGYMRDTVYVRDNRSLSEVAIPVRSIRDFRRLESLDRGASARRSARVGLFLGTGVGVLAGAGVGTLAPHDQHTLWVFGTTVASALIGAGLGAAWGALSPGDRWQAYRVPALTGPLP